MGLRRLAFLNFRNLADRELAVDARQVLLVGENGQGKTNLLEAVYLLCVGSSFRERAEAALLREPSLPGSVFGTYGFGTHGQTERTDLAGAASAEPERTLAVGWQQPGARKEMRIDGKPIVDRAELLALLLCVCFVQEDMEIVAGPPELRRRFFDQTLTLSDLSWLGTLRAYRRVLRSRNLALRAHHEELLDVFDEQLAPLGLEIQRRRVALTADFNTVFEPMVSAITSGVLEVRISYRPSWAGLDNADEVAAALGAERQRDLLLGATSSGPHLDRFLYVSGGKDFTRFASTGQRRLCALALRVAMTRFLAERTARRPILLLDDVLLELDSARKRAVVERFPDYEQAFFTFLPDENWLSYRGSDALVLKVERGDFKAWGNGPEARNGMRKGT